MKPSDGGRIRLYLPASYALDDLFVAAAKEKIYFHINDAYRTVADQKGVWGRHCSNAIGTGTCIPLKGKQAAAPVGTSNHGYGIAVDLAIPSTNARVKPGSAQYTWLTNNAAKFGFATLRPGQFYESHHWEYQKI